MQITSPFAANTGALIINLAQRGIIVKVSLDERVIGGKVLYLQATLMRAGKSATIKEALSEREVEDIQDINVIADAISSKLRSQLL